MRLFHLNNQLGEDSAFPSAVARYAKEFQPFFTAQMLVRVYYFFLLYVSIVSFPQWGSVLGAQTEISFILPIFWLKFVSFPVGLTIIRIFFIATTILASVAPHLRWVRILSFVGLWQFVSLYFSMLLLDVDWYTPLLVSFLLIFLPDKWQNASNFSEAGRKNFLLVFWGCLAIDLLTYSMAGIGKVVGAISQIMQGQISIFDPNAASLHIADRLLVTGATSPLGPWLVDHPFVAWLFLLGSTYLLLFSFLVAFRPKLQRVWGLALILFHIANFFVINIGFSAHIFVDSLLLLLSPFAPAKTSWREIVRSLPVVDLFMRNRQPQTTWSASNTKQE